MIMNIELERMRKEKIVAYLKVLSRNSPRGYEENHEIEVEVPARM
jgi:hypothetical protein